MTVERRECEGFAFNHSSFLLKGAVSFNHQFSLIYNARLSGVHDVCVSHGKGMWPDTPYLRVVNVLDDKCFIIGVLYKNMQTKPNFLTLYKAEMEEGERIELNKQAESFGATAGDTLSLEDTSGRIDLSGNIQPAELATGMVVLCMGTPQGGTFVVEQWAFSPLRANASIPAPVADRPPMYVAFISGLSFGKDATAGLELQLDAACSFLRGNLGCLEIVQNIARLVIAGGLITPTVDLLSRDKIKLESGDYDLMQSGECVTPMEKADAWIAQVAEHLPVDIVPSSTDPTNPFLPYQPIHPCMLPKTHKLETTAPVTCPYRFTVRGSIDCIVTSGENLADLQTCTLNQPVEQLMRVMLKSGHIAPTAPDTLYCYPFQEVDPFQFERPAHLLLCGNAPAYSSQFVQGAGGEFAYSTRLVTIPSFNSKPGITIVDFNSSDLETKFIPIDISAS